ncbi:MAG: DNA repair protein RadC [Brevibacillus sp.]|nr:DNA repair protein RadC [Brevibacillus sp.]
MDTISIYQVKLQKVGSLPVATRSIYKPADAAAIFQAYLEQHCHTDRENIIGMYLNTKNQVVGMSTIHTGSLNVSLINPREVFTEAVLHKAASVILCHNHPSGNPSPSREDIQITSSLQQAGEVLDIPVLDHIILGHNQFLSLKEKGYMEQTQSKGEWVWESQETERYDGFRRNPLVQSMER